ncbi:hypothetical protein Pelo_14936 [Pelomyxa schiedti]|nr:hypothetical protein Pelo_14936 [Pelomyxa schiedti]
MSGATTTRTEQPDDNNTADSAQPREAIATTATTSSEGATEGHEEQGAPCMKDHAGGSDSGDVGGTEERRRETERGGGGEGDGTAWAGLRPGSLRVRVTVSVPGSALALPRRSSRVVSAPVVVNHSMAEGVTEEVEVVADEKTTILNFIFLALFKHTLWEILAKDVHMYRLFLTTSDGLCIQLDNRNLIGSYHISSKDLMLPALCRFEPQFKNYHITDALALHEVPHNILHVNYHNDILQDNSSPVSNGPISELAEGFVSVLSTPAPKTFMPTPFRVGVLMYQQREYKTLLFDPATSARDVLVFLWQSACIFGRKSPLPSDLPLSSSRPPVSPSPSQEIPSEGTDSPHWSQFTLTLVSGRTGDSRILSHDTLLATVLSQISSDSSQWIQETIVFSEKQTKEVDALRPSTVSRQTEHVPSYAPLASCIILIPATGAYLRKKFRSETLVAELLNFAVTNSKRDCPSGTDSWALVLCDDAFSFMDTAKCIGEYLKPQVQLNHQTNPSWKILQ